MLLERLFGPAVYSQVLGEVVARVYSSGARYLVFIVGEHLASFLGDFEALEDCLEEIDSLESLVQSDVFQKEVARHC